MNVIYVGSIRALHGAQVVQAQACPCGCGRRRIRVQLPSGALADLAHVRPLSLREVSHNGSLSEAAEVAHLMGE